MFRVLADVTAPDEELDVVSNGDDGSAITLVVIAIVAVVIVVGAIVLMNYLNKKTKNKK